MADHTLRLTILLALLAPGVVLAQSATPVATLDLPRYTGTWYEVAHLPDKQEKQCVGDNMVLYALADKARRFQVVDSCRLKDGTADIHNRDGKTDGTGSGRLKLTYLFLLSNPHWVLATGPEYEWALVGTPNHKTLRVLSRTVTLKPEVRQQIEAQAKAQGFDTAKLMTVSQTAHTEATQPDKPGQP